MAFIIKSNASQGTDVLIGDMGIIIPNSGGTETLVDVDAIQQAVESLDLRDYLTDDAYGAGSSTLILNDGSGDVAQADALNFLDTYLLPLHDQDYGVVKTDAAGEITEDLVTNSSTPSALTNWQLGSDLDANSNQINNLSQASASGEAVEWQQWQDNLNTSRVWKELLLAEAQCDSTNDCVAQAIAFFLDEQPSSGDTLVIDDGTTSRTYGFGSGGDVTVTIGADVDATMENLATSITGDGSGLWDAERVENLESINDGSGSSTAGYVVVIYREDNSAADSYDDRIYSSGANTTPADWQYVNYNGELDYEISTNTQLASTDPAQKEFGIGRATANLVANETHEVRNEDSIQIWDNDDGVWQNAGSASVVAGAGLTKTGNTINVIESANGGLIINADDMGVDWGEVGDIQPLGLTAAAGTSYEVADASHVHTHGDLSGEATPTDMHTAEQVEVAGTYTDIGSPADVEEALSNINDLFGAGAGAQAITFGQSIKVPGGGTLYLRNGGGVLTSAAPVVIMRACVLEGAFISVDNADATRAYKLSILKNGTEVASVALGTSTAKAYSVALNQSFAANDELSVSVVRTSGSGSSTFGNIAAGVELNYS